LGQRVEVLLCAAENAGGFLEHLPTGLSGDADSTSLLRENFVPAHSEVDVLTEFAPDALRGVDFRYSDDL
jgi:hypothetical protein